MILHKSFKRTLLYSAQPEMFLLGSKFKIRTIGKGDAANKIDRKIWLTILHDVATEEITE